MKDFLPMIFATLLRFFYLETCELRVTLSFFPTELPERPQKAPKMGLTKRISMKFSPLTNRTKSHKNSTLPDGLNVPNALPGWRSGYNNSQELTHQAIPEPNEIPVRHDSRNPRGNGILPKARLNVSSLKHSKFPKFGNPTQGSASPGANRSKNPNDALYPRLRREELALNHVIKGPRIENAEILGFPHGRRMYSLRGAPAPNGATPQPPYISHDHVRKPTPTRSIASAGPVATTTTIPMQISPIKQELHLNPRRRTTNASRWQTPGKNLRLYQTIE